MLRGSLPQSRLRRASSLPEGAEAPAGAGTPSVTACGRASSLREGAKGACGREMIKT